MNLDNIKENMAENLRSDLPNEKTLNQKCPLDIPTYLNANSSILMECDHNKLKKNTKFLAKAYFDRSLIHNPNFSKKDLELYLISCYRAAIKWNERMDVSDSFTLNVCLELCENRFSTERFKKQELLLLDLLNFKTNQSTPYDYLASMKPLLQFQKDIVGQMEKTIDYALTLEASFGAKAQTICLGSLLYVCKHLIPSKNLKVIQEMSTNWNLAEKFEETIRISQKKDVSEGSYQ